jgi:ABC-2 type transport system permease protein
MGKQSAKFQSILTLTLLLVVLVLLNTVSYHFYERIDLTKEKRYTLSKATKELLKNLNDDIFIRVYLEGEFPAGFKRLRNATQDMLAEFRAASKGKIHFIFEDPLADKNEQEKKEIYDQLMAKGLQPTNLRVNTDDQYSSKVIFPGAIVRYRDREISLQLLENQIGLGPQEVLNNSVELLEYKIANKIKKITQRVKPTIAFTEGHGELPDENLTDIKKTLDELQYDVIRINPKDIAQIPNRYGMLVIAKPTEAFKEQEKFKIDQYIMNGGSVLWLLDAVDIEMDSLKGKEFYLANKRDLNLDDQLFRYGARLNPYLVQDLQCNKIPLVVGMLGNQPQTEMFPWFYYPVLMGNDNHAIVRNLDAIHTQYINTVDTVRAPNVNKTFLLTTSNYSKALMSPVRVHFSMLKEQPDPATYNKKNIPVSVLLEGQFSSVFKNRLAPETKAAMDSLKISFKEESKFSKMIVVADGDIIKNEISSRGGVLPLGYYSFTNQTYANKDFILNCIEYLADDMQLIETRNKEIKLRLLDRQKIQQEKLFWQLLNMLVPFASVVIFGIVYNFIRRRKYAV